MIKLTDEEKTTGVMILGSYLFVMIGAYFDSDNLITYKSVIFVTISTIIALLLFTINIYLCRKNEE